LAGLVPGEQGAETPGREIGGPGRADRQRARVETVGAAFRHDVEPRPERAEARWARAVVSPQERAAPVGDGEVERVERGRRELLEGGARRARRGQREREADELTPGSQRRIRWGAGEHVRDRGEDALGREADPGSAGDRVARRGVRDATCHAPERPPLRGARQPLVPVRRDDERPAAVGPERDREGAHGRILSGSGARRQRYERSPAGWRGFGTAERRLDAYFGAAFTDWSSRWRSFS